MKTLFSVSDYVPVHTNLTDQDQMVLIGNYEASVKWNNELKLDDTLDQDLSNAKASFQIEI